MKRKQKILIKLKRDKWSNEKVINQMISIIKWYISETIPNYNFESILKLILELRGLSLGQ